MSPEDAFRPFKGYQPPFIPWHDATRTHCSFLLTILDTLRGLYKARELGFFSYPNFDIADYEHFEQVENGDLSWCMDGKFIAFAGPHLSNEPIEGYHALPPDHYIPYFKKRNVTLVVRFNKKCYDAARFKNAGIDHIDLYFEDGSNPPDHILARFLEACETTPGAIAVHCKAGLGRTGTCIGAYMMKHFGLTAEETIGWLRIVRPGSVIGQQQHFLKSIQSRLWREGELYRSKMATQKRDLGESHSRTSGEESTERDISNDFQRMGLGGVAPTTRTGSALEAMVGGSDGSDREITQGDTLRMRRAQGKKGEGGAGIMHSNSGDYVLPRISSGGAPSSTGIITNSVYSSVLSSFSFSGGSSGSLPSPTAPPAALLDTGAATGGIFSNGARRPANNNISPLSPINTTSGAAPSSPAGGTPSSSLRRLMSWNLGGR
jgi:cell division cycle 14